MSLHKLESEAYLLPADAGYPLAITAKRYWLKSPEAVLPERQDARHHHGLKDDALTIVTLHSTSFHKEIWEPSLETLFNLAEQESASVTPPPRRRWIREAWVIECPNHGESASLNGPLFLTPEFATEFGCQGYANAVVRFMNKNADMFINRRLVGLGHSLGANTILLAQDLLANPHMRFVALIIVEPMISPDGASHLDNLRAKLMAAAAARQETFPSRDAAKKFLRGRKWKRKGKWDERVLDVFTKFAMRPTVTGGEQTMTLACTRQQEMAMYADVHGPTAPVEVLNRICHRMPIHLILGEINDFIPRRVHDALVSKSSGRVYASIASIPHVGHLIPQEKPDELAAVVHNILLQVYRGDQDRQHRPRL